MSGWLGENWGNLLVGGLLLAALTMIVVCAIRRRGTGGCCCGCSGCDRRRECGRD